MTLATADAANLAKIFNTREFGESISYDPAAAGISTFTAVAIFQKIEVDTLDSRVVRDVIMCRIPHATLTAAGMTEPIARYESNTGDKITRTGPAGSEIWNVVDKEYDLGLWTLTLEKNIRITP